MLSLSVFFAHAQTIVVKDAGSSEPIPGVVLYNFKKNKSVVTDIDGKADLNIFKNNIKTLKNLTKMTFITNIVLKITLTISDIITNPRFSFA